jgi:hypothetical protein
VITLDDSVRLVSMQFSFSNINVVPTSVKKLELEMLEERNERKTYKGNGEVIIKPIENVSLVEFLDNLEVGYELVDAFYQPRIDPKDPRGNRIYHMVRFLFARRKYVELSDEFKEVRSTIHAELRKICEQAMWRVRAFLNPFFMDDEEVLGQRALSINLEARKPLFHPDGQLVMVWQKDERGNRVGETPFPLKPDYYLRIEDNVVQSLMA